MVEKYGGKLCLSGDADFGMKRNNTFNKDTYAYKKAEEYFSPNSPEDLMHSISNFSLMVVNGGMNCKKGFKKYRDIFPLFLCSVDKYYKIKDKDEKKEYIKNELGQIAAGGRPPKGMTKVEHDESIEERYNKFDKIDVYALMCYLDTFEGFDDYCKRTYFFGEDSEEIKNMLDEIKDYGKNVTDKSFYECENIKKYCDLAKRYWKIREGIMDNKQANEKSQ